MPSPTDNTFEGYMFYRADSLLRSKPDWRFVERIPLQIKQRKLGKMVYDRAALCSPVKQQQDLNGDRLRHINQLVADRREVFPGLYWTVAYLEESVCAHGRREVMAPDYQQEHDIVSMVVILLARPQQEGKYAKGLIGDLVDIVRVGNDSGHSIGHSSASSVVSEFGGTQDTHCVSTWLGDPKSERSDPGELSLTESEKNIVNNKRSQNPTAGSPHPKRICQSASPRWSNERDQGVDRFKRRPPV